MAGTIADLVSDFMERERPIGILLDEDTVTAQAIAATRIYAGYGGLKAFDYEEPDAGAITAETPLSTSEWAVIRPLFVLYLEKETALQLEASRGMGVDPYGRSSSEIASEIMQAEQAMPLQAFCVPAFEVGEVSA